MQDQIQKIINLVFKSMNLAPAKEKELREELFQTLVLQFIARVSPALSPDELAKMEEINKTTEPENEKLIKIQEIVKNSPAAKSAVADFVNHDLTETIDKFLTTFMENASEEERHRFAQLSS